MVFLLLSLLSPLFASYLCIATDTSYFFKQGFFLREKIGGDFTTGSLYTPSLSFSFGLYEANIKNPQGIKQRIQYSAIFASIGFDNQFQITEKQIISLGLSAYLTVGGKYGITTSGSTGCWANLHYGYEFFPNLVMYIGPSLVYTFAGDYHGFDSALDLSLKWRV